MSARGQVELLPPEFEPAEPVERVRKKSKPEEIFGQQCRAYRLPEFRTQYQFATSLGRKWSSDFAWPQFGLIVEIEGLVMRRLEGQLVVMGRHASITGFKEDAIKYASAVVLGFAVLRFEQSQVKDNTAIEYTMRALAAKGWKQ
jgi:very-short-patch-repair endonuclease